MSEADELQYVLVRLDSTDLLKMQGSVAEIQKRLKNYSLSQILNLLGKMGAALHFTRQGRLWEIQKAIFDGLFGMSSSTIWGRVLRAQQQLHSSNSKGSVIVFTPVQVYLLAKIALMTPLPPTANTTRSPEEDLCPFGEAALMASHLINLFGMDESSPEDNVLKCFVTGEGDSFRGDNAMMMARANLLYLTDRPNLKDDPDYCDLPAIAAQVLGIPPAEYRAICFGISSYWMNLKPQDIPAGATALDVPQFLATCDFRPDEIAKYLEHVSIRAERLSALIARDYSEDQIRPFHNVHFLGFPLIEHEGRSYCLSPSALMARSSDGLHHLFLRRHTASARFFRYMGRVFEDHVSILSRRAFPLIRQDALYLPLDDYRARFEKQGIRCADGVIMMANGNAIVLEVKAARLSADARAGGDAVLTRERLGDILATGQHESTIKAIEAGILRDQGLRPEKIRRYFPVIISLENLFMSGFLYREFRCIGWPGGCCDPKIAPLQLIDIEEYEMLSEGAILDLDLASLIDAKTQNPSTCGMTMANYLHQVDRKINSRYPNRYMHKVYDEDSKACLAFFRARGISRAVPELTPPPPS